MKQTMIVTKKNGHANQFKNDKNSGSISRDKIIGIPYKLTLYLSPQTV